MQSKFLSCLYIMISLAAHSQLRIQPGTTVYLQAGAYLVTTGNVASSVNIAGTGTLKMKGSAAQTLSMSGLTVPRLEIDNAAGVSLISNARVNALNFVTGKLKLANFALYLNTTTVITGASAAKFIETNGTGQLIKSLSANVSAFLLPVGTGNNYTPVSLTTSGTYASAFVGLNCKPVAHPNKPASATSYLNTYWTLKRSGVTGTVSAVATYAAANVVGTESTLRAYLWNGSAWVLTGGINTTTNQITESITGSAADIYAMNAIAAGTTAYPEITATEKNLGSSGIFPNPAGSQATLKIDMPADELISITIVDQKGTTVMQEQVRFTKGAAQHLLKLEALSKGLYDVHVKSSGVNKTFKLVKL
jgi:hypothetical protein